MRAVIIDIAKSYPREGSEKPWMLGVSNAIRYLSLGRQVYNEGMWLSKVKLYEVDPDQHHYNALTRKLGHVAPTYTDCIIY